MRASTLARKSARLQVEPTLVEGVVDPGLAAGAALETVLAAGAPASPPPPHAASSPHRAVATTDGDRRNESEVQVIARG
jgi:hypothetical protein